MDDEPSWFRSEVPAAGDELVFLKTAYPSELTVTKRFARQIYKDIRF